ncbi:MAG: hypothetical protein J0L97_03530 [Alphaproteobacteria bacterium]|nr:hypothetical protein [Alphaproteobacteria bacterium]
MALAIATFSNALSPGQQNALSKALGHPLVAEKARALVSKLAKEGPIAIVDPWGQGGTFDLYFKLADCKIAGTYVQNIEEVGRDWLGHKAKPLSELSESPVSTVLITAFDAGRLAAQLKNFIPGKTFLTLDEIRLPEAMLTNPKDFLHPLNFATNLGFLRDGGGLHTRLTSVNYWPGHGAKNPGLWLCLYDADGNPLATWEEPLGKPDGVVTIDSAEIRARFKLPEFTGSLYMHGLRVAGHDTVKYVVDTYGDDRSVLSATHDANAWPADFYAGLPAPEKDEQVLLWVQNSHPIPIPAGEVGLRLMGDERTVFYDKPIPPFATRAIDVAALLPEARWPQQLEILAGRYFVRPRYEILRGKVRRIAHANVERIDLKPDPTLASRSVLGKGYILPLAVPPLDAFDTTVLPTPMATGQQELPLMLTLYDATGQEVAKRALGKLARKDSVAIDISSWLREQKRTLPSGFGHAELTYDFSSGSEADGWLHAIARYRQTASGHEAETSFGAHIYNIPDVYRGEPQSYIGRPPGLSTRLCLRVAKAEETFCHLIYPASKPWLKESTTDLLLHDGDGVLVHTHRVTIPCGGSLFWKLSDYFDASQIALLNGRGYVLVRDLTCRLFGFHGASNGDASFALDHMFGF